MSRHSQSRKWKLRHVLAMLLGAAISAVAGTYLVRSAIDFGRLARDDEPVAWLFTGTASLGAAVCALIGLVLLIRTLRIVGLISDYRPRRIAARKRAK